MHLLAHRARHAVVAAAGLLFSLCTTGQGRAADAAPEAEDLRRGLVATYRDQAKPTAAEIVRLEPTIALRLQASESVHPRLMADGLTAKWQGYVTIFRPGEYHFQVRLRGQLKLLIAGKEVLNADGAGEKPLLKAGPLVKLEAGVHPLVVEFTRRPGPTVVELLWQSPYFRLEPLPFDHLGHLPAKAPARLPVNQQIEHGRFLAEEMNCLRCHLPDDGDKVAKGIAGRQGPDLSQVGQRVRPEWIERWLDDPHKLQPGAVMPAMFPADANGRTERFVVARYLASLGGPMKPAAKQPNANDLRSSVNRGRKLYTSVGCAVCHGPYGDDAPIEKKAATMPQSVFHGTPRTYPLRELATKTTPEKLAEYLANPLAVDPSGRMPHMLLNGQEVQDLARYLCPPSPNSAVSEPPAKALVLAAFKRVENRAEELTTFERLPDDLKWIDLGKRLVIERGCNNCHTIAPGGKPFASMQASADLADLRKPEKQSAGCLADDPPKVGPAPRFALTNSDRQVLRMFLREGLTGPNTPSPTYTAALDFQRFNCLACHARDGEGGLTAEQSEQLRRYENVENAESLTPPPLTGVGHKLRTPWLQQVLTGGARARPWMGLRMPQFGPHNVKHLPEALAALEGADPDDTVHKIALSAAKLEAGRTLVGKNAFGCISCHDISGIANSGTRGPDMATTNQRIRFDWYLRWLEQAQRIQPGTRMPSIFTDGKSLMTTVLGGHAPAQAEAIWAYLSLGTGLPLPDGLEPPKGLTVAVTDRPVLLRTFLPEVGSRGIAVGYPGGISIAFDANACRPGYAWSGNFLDASPVWANRGGSPASVLGIRFWTGTPGCSVATTDSQTPPDFAARAKDPVYGGPLKEGTILDRPKLLHFDGYSTNRAGVPTFRYRLGEEGKATTLVEERFEPHKHAVAFGLTRRLTVQAPPRQFTWLLAGESNAEPRQLVAGGVQTLDLKSGSLDLPTDNTQLVLQQDNGDRVTVLSAKAPPESRWLLQKSGNRWQALLRMPPIEKSQVDVTIWSPYKNEPELLKELLTDR